MFEISIFNVDKFIHTLIQNLRLKIKSPIYNNFKKIAFVTYIDRTCKIKQQLPCFVDISNEINIQRNWDFSNEKDIQYFIEKHTSFFDKLISLRNTGTLTFPLKNINLKILQQVRKRKKDNENTKKLEIKIKKKRSLSFISDKDKCLKFYKYKKNKFGKAAICENSKTLNQDIITFNNPIDVNIFETKNQQDFVNYNLSDDMISVTEKQIKIAQKFLFLHIKNKDYIKRNIQITLYISKKTICANMKNQMNYNKILCHHAILCLIEPSKKAVVLFEDDLSVVIRRYLLYGYKYNFEFQRYST